MAKRKKKRWKEKDLPGKGGATKPPMCRLCHTRHWSSEPHKLSDKPAIQYDDIKVKP